MITEIDAGHVIYDDLSPMQLERRLKGHIPQCSISGEEPMVNECIPDKGVIVIIPKEVSANKKYFNDCTIVVNILLKDIEHEANPNLNQLLKAAYALLNADRVGQVGEDWYRYNVRSHGIGTEKQMGCHYANIIIDFQILNVKR